MRLPRAATAALLVGALSCSSPDDQGVSGKIGPEGGVFEAEGLTLSVPEGALNELVSVTITALDAGGTEVAGRVRVSRVFQITPDTVRFLIPATVTLTYDPALLPARVVDAQVDLRHTDYSKPTPERLASLSVDATARTVSGETGGLGTFWATAPEGARAVSLTVSPASKTVYVGDAVAFSAEVRDQNGAVMTDQAVQWELDNPLVASIDESGAVATFAPGTATVTARVGAVRGTATLQVASPDAFAQSFAWENPLPGSTDLYAVQGSLLALAVAGDHGSIAVRSGSTFQRLSSAPLTRLRGLAFRAPEAVAVGAYQTTGILLRWDGTALTRLIVPDTDLAAVWMDGQGGLAAGDGPNAALREAGGAWAVAPSPVTEPLLAVSGDAAGNPVAVGARGAVYKRIDGAWQALNAEPLPEYQLSAAASGEEAWAVSGTTLRHFVSGAWVSAALPAEPALTLSKVALAGTALAVAGKDASGKTYVLVDDGSGWRATCPPGEVYGLGGESAQDLYAVGPKGSIARLDGDAWTELRQGPVGDVVGLSAFEGPAVWAATNECVDEACTALAGKVFKRGAGGAWSDEAVPFTGAIDALVGRSASDLWALGEGGEAWHLEAAGWVARAVGEPGYTSAVACNGDLYAVNGTRLLEESNGLWTVALSYARPLEAVACWGNGVFAVGDYYVARTDGGQTVELNPNDDLIYSAHWRAVWATVDGHAFIGGDARYLLHWTGEKFEAMDQPANVPIVSTRAVWGTSFGNVWAGGKMSGDTSFLIHFNGAYWQSVDPGMDGALSAIAGLSYGSLWVAGPTGSLLMGSPATSR